jgi:hypothetical protein
MGTRRSFLAGTIAAAAGIAAASSGASAAPPGSPTPHPTPTPKPPTPPPAAAGGPTKPSAPALELAKKLQKDLPQAKISDAMAERIASDIEDGFSLSQAFRKAKFKNWDEPDFVFSAEENEA